MSRNLQTQTIKRFRGLNVWTSFAATSPEFASDLLNVIPSSSGAVEKLRVPVDLSEAITGLGSGPERFQQYQNSAGARQVIAQFGTDLYSYDLDWVSTLIDSDPDNADLFDFIESNNLFFGVNGTRNLKWDGASISKWGIDPPSAAPTLGATPAGALTFTLGGRRYRISFGNSVTGHIGNASDASAATGNLATQEQIVTGPASTDPQCDLAILWATVDGGGDYYFAQEITIVPLAAPSFTDNTPDDNLNFALIAPLINDVPPVGKYLATFQGRTFILNLTEDHQGVAYSGYERILVGRPEESFPENNRLRLALGADDIRGAGAIANGLVIFSRSNQMFILRGILQDVTVDAPVQLSAFLQPLPWSQGCFSHYSIAETPQGLVWLASDKTIQIYDGQNPPQSLSKYINPILRRITAGSEENARGEFFNYLEREWYVLTVSIDNSATNNLMIIIDLDPDAESNGGIFISDIEADDVGTVEDASGNRSLVIAAEGLLKQFIALSDTVNGISDPITATEEEMNAYWRSSPFGGEAPGLMKIFRFAHIVTDQSGFRIQTRLITEAEDFRNPTLGLMDPLPEDGRYPVNQKGRRLMYEIQFPAEDVSANLLELSNSYIPLGER